MTATDTATAGGVTTSRRGMPAWVLGLVLFLAFCAVRTLTDESDITSVGTFNAALTLAVPIAMAGLGALWSERSGVVNIGLEGMMALGTWFGAYFGWKLESPWFGLLFAALAGMAGGALLALAAVNFAVNHVVAGTAINIFAPGLASYLSGALFVGIPGAGPKQSPPIEPFTTVTLPGAGALDDLNKEGIFVVSDLAGIIGGLVTRVSLITIFALLLYVLSWFVLWRMAIGLRIRASGENPWAAESLGVNVINIKWLAVLVSGFMAGVGGMALVNQTTKYVANQTAGRGFIGIAAMIFGNYMPGGTAAGSGLFGYSDALQLRANSAVVALLLFVAIVALVFALNSFLKGKAVSGIVLVVVAAAIFLLWLSFGEGEQLATQFVAMTPYLITLVVLAATASTLRAPAADGVEYRRGEH